MGIKFNENKCVWEAFFSKRHPITRESVGLRRLAKSKADALRTEKELVVLVERKLQESIVPRWSTAISECLTSMGKSGVTAKTVKTYGECLRAHTGSWMDQLVSDITTDQIQNLIFEDLQEKSTSHQKNLLKFIRKVFSYLVDKGALQRNPVPKIKFKISHKVRLVLTEKQSRQRLHEAMRRGTDWYPVWATALYTGMRSGELYALAWADVDFEAKLIRIKRSWNQTDGFKSTKSGDERII